MGWRWVEVIREGLGGEESVWSTRKWTPKEQQMDQVIQVAMDWVMLTGFNQT